MNFETMVQNTFTLPPLELLLHDVNDVNDVLVGGEGAGRGEVQGAALLAAEGSPEPLHSRYHATLGNAQDICHALLGRTSFTSFSPNYRHSKYLNVNTVKTIP